MKYKIGDEVKVIGKSGIYHFFKIGDIVEIVSIGSSVVCCRKGDKTQTLHVADIEPVTNSKVTKITPYMRKKYILLKDTPTVKKGAIYEECEKDGEYPYFLITPEHNKYPDVKGYYKNKDIVEKNPKWFKEVTLIYVAKEQVKKVEKFLKKLI